MLALWKARAFCESGHPCKAATARGKKVFGKGGRGNNEDEKFESGNKKNNLNLRFVTNINNSKRNFSQSETSVAKPAGGFRSPIWCLVERTQTDTHTTGNN